MTTIVDVARQAYDAYGRVTDHKNYQGLPMPTWGDLGIVIQQAWIEATRSTYVVGYFDADAGRDSLVLP